MNETAAAAAVLVAGLALWKGKAIRAQLTLTGEGWNNLHPEVQRRARLVLADAARQGLNVGVFEGWRDEQRQRQVMGQGTSWVGEWRNSYHVWGLAVDFVFLDDLGRWTWEPDGERADWDRLGAIIEANGFEWGGRFRNFDGPHAQLPLRRVADLRRDFILPDNWL